jgi:hypothetical protein
MCHFVYLSVNLSLSAYKAGQYLRDQRQVSEEELCLLVKTQQREVVPQLHGDDCILLLQRGRKAKRDKGIKRGTDQH